jgi:putative AdoMet-dependent methyltransferase
MCKEPKDYFNRVAGQWDETQEGFFSKEGKTWDFDDWAERYDEVVAAGSEIYARYDDVLEMVVKLAGISPGKRVLDIGTGTGNLALRCLARGAVVVGLDPSKRMLAKVREKVGSNLRAEFHQVDEPFLHVPYPDASFDAVVSTYAFHHIPHRLKHDSAHEMIRVLKPGGVWALGDLVFESEEAEREALRKYEWLEEEYFVRIEELRPVFAGLPGTPGGCGKADTLS